MDERAAVRAILAETTVFLSYFKEMPDRRQQGKVPQSSRRDIAFEPARRACGGRELHRHGQKKLALLRRFRPFEHGTPAHDHLGDIFATLDAESFRRCFVA